MKTLLKRLFGKRCNHQWDMDIVYPDIGWSASFVKECKCCGKVIIMSA